MMFTGWKKRGFTATDYICVFLKLLITAGLLYFFSMGIHGNDFWWHVKAGEWIVTHRAVPSQDMFSWYGIEHGLSWTPHEWLSEVVFYVLFSRWGERGIYLFVTAAAAALLWLMWDQAKVHIRRNPLAGGVFFGLFLLVVPLFFYGRPHIFSFFFLFFELKLLYGYMEHPGSNRIFLVPLLAALWSNFHGGSSNLSYILCLVFAVGNGLPFRLGRIASERMEKRALAKLLLAAALSAAAILINPIGKEVLLYPYVNMADKSMLTYISEWNPPDAKDTVQLFLFYLPIVLMSVGLVSGEKKTVRLTDVLVMGMFLLLFFRSVRFIFLWYVAAVFYGFPYLPSCRIEETGKRWEKPVFTAFVVSAALLSAAGLMKVGETCREGDMIEEVLSEQMVETVREEAPKRILNDYSAGESLIFYGLPVFFDGRADLYRQDHIFEDGMSLIMMRQANSEAEEPYVDVEALMEKYGFDGILMMKQSPLYAYLVSHPERYALVFEDETGGYFSVKD